MTEIANRLHDDEAIEGLILGGTELQLAQRLRDQGDTARFHLFSDKDAVTALISEGST